MEASIQRLRLLTQSSATFVATFGVLVLLGWALESDLLKSFYPGLVSMNPATAVLFILTAACLFLHTLSLKQRKVDWLTPTLGAIISGGGLLTLIEFVSNLQLRLDRILFSESLGPNRMAPNTAFYFTCLGVALLSAKGRRTGHWLGQVLTLTVLGGAGVSLLGYGYGAKNLYGVGSYIPMALNTALVFMVAALGLLGVHGNRGFLSVLMGANSGSAMARLLLPTAVVAPCVIGSLRIAGQRAGLYDTEFGTALMVIATVFLLVTAITLTAGKLNRTDIERSTAQDGLQRVHLELRSQSQVLQSILDSMGDGVVVADQHGKFMLFNPAAERILGRGPSDDGPEDWTARYGCFLSDGVTSYPPHQLPLARALRGENVDDEEMFVRNAALPNGAWLSIAGRALRDDNRALRGGVVVFHDISERKRADDQIRKLNATLEQQLLQLTAANHDLAAKNQQIEMFRLLVENVRGYAIILLDPSGNILTWNAGAQRIKGYSPDEIIGRHFSVFYPSEVVESGWLERELETAKNEGRFEEEQWRVRKDGSKFWANVIITAVRDRDGRLLGFGKVTRDLTERKQAEEALQTANQLLECRVVERTEELRRAKDLAEDASRNLAAILQVSVDAIITMDHEGKIRGFNPAAETMFGYPVAEVLGQPLAELVIPPYLRAGYSQGLRNFLTNGISRVLEKRLELSAIRADGSEFPVELTVTKIPVEGPPIFTGFLRDITERKRAEEQVHALNAELERQLLQLTEVNRDLSEKNQENEMFVYSVSHDLRSPLVNLLGFSKELATTSGNLRQMLTESELPSVAKDPALRLIDQDMRESIHFIQTAVTRLSGIIDALLRLSRAGRIEYQLATVDTGGVVARVVESMSGSIFECGATIRVVDLPNAYGDANSVEQIFANLIGNAIKYSDPSRPCEIEVGYDPAQPDAPANCQGAYYVRDNGLGIAEAYLPKIFQAFKRLHPHIASGEGMGLAIVRRMVERLGGNVWVKSEVGAGSTFFVALPFPPTELKQPLQERTLEHERSAASHFVR